MPFALKTTRGALALLALLGGTAPAGAQTRPTAGSPPLRLVARLFDVFAGTAPLP